MIDLPSCPAEGEAPRHSWIMSAANRYAHRAIKEAVDLITSKLTRAPSPYNEVETTVRKAFKEAADYAGHNGGDVPPQPAYHTPDVSSDGDRAAKDRAAKRAAWPEFTAPSEAQREAISKLLVVAPEAIEALGGMETLFCAESSEGSAIVICDRKRKTAASLRLDGEPWKSSPGKLEKFLPGSERGWPVGLEAGASPIFLAAGAAGLVRMFHLLWCADMEREVIAAALLDTPRPIAPAACHLLAGRKVCAGLRHGITRRKHAARGWRARLHFRLLPIQAR